jgi:hypothetical protein
LLTNCHRHGKPGAKNTSPVERKYHTRSTYFSTAAAQNLDVKPASKLSVASRPTELPASSWEVPHLIKTPWELERYRKTSAWKHVKPDHQIPTHLFKTLPREVYDCIVTQLEQIHIRGNPACPSCYIGDFYRLALVSRDFEKAVTKQM